MLKKLCQCKLYYTYCAVLTLFAFLFMMLGGFPYVGKLIVSFFQSPQNLHCPDATHYCEQIKQAPFHWSEPITIATFALVFVTAVLAGAALKQTMLTREDFTATHRPWIQAEVRIPENENMVFDESGMHITLHIYCKNHGRTPAVNVSITTSIDPNRRESDSVSVVVQEGQELETQGKIAAVSSELAKAKDAPGRTIFPGRTELTASYVYKIDKKGLAMGRRYSDDPRENDGVRIAIVGCADYKFTFGDGESHQTGFAYHIFRRHPGDDTARHIVPEHGTVERRNLLRIEHAIGRAFYAN